MERQTQLRCRVLVDPDRLDSEEDSFSKDALDFRHHNYNEMRKVGVGAS